mgnify:CR=1 FL=1
MKFLTTFCNEIMIVGPHDIFRECSINLNEFRDGQRHDMWLSLQNVKVGRLHLAITVTEGNGKVILVLDLSSYLPVFFRVPVVFLMIVIYNY